MALFFKAKAVRFRIGPPRERDVQSGDELLGGDSTKATHNSPNFSFVTADQSAPGFSVTVVHRVKSSQLWNLL